MLLRANPELEVLMVLRPTRGFFGGLVVFPGGALEDCDSTLEGFEPDMDFRIAGLRETAEEIVLVLDEEGARPTTPGANGPLRGGEMLRSEPDEVWKRGAERMQLVSRWVTPESAPSRFDTRFYAVEVEGDPDLALDSAELVDHAWVNPSNALAKHDAGAWDMILPTLSHLRWLAKWKTPSAAIGAAVGTDGLTVIQPGLEDGAPVVRYRCEHDD
jgi:8-oxo-dGTP pyrophosphatase MutT (NUDIX family)